VEFGVLGGFEAVVVDVNDLERAMAFWSGVIGETFGAPVQPTFRRARLDSSLNVVLHQAPKAKARKNRVDLEIEVDD
jgi:hypothetical protein